MLKNPIIRFLLALILLLALSFLIHLKLLAYFGHPLFENKIILAYIVNILLAIAIYLVMYILRTRQAPNLGFIFMLGSGVKLLLFFLLFYSSYNSDGDMSRLEFAAFFTPYALCLTIETVFLSRVLSRMDSN